MYFMIMKIYVQILKYILETFYVSIYSKCKSGTFKNYIQLNSPK